MVMYTYQGPVTGLTLPGQERMLHPGGSYELPADHPLVYVLEARGHLRRCHPDAPAAPPPPLPEPAGGEG